MEWLGAKYLIKVNKLKKMAHVENNPLRSKSFKLECVNENATLRSKFVLFFIFLIQLTSYVVKA